MADKVIVVGAGTTGFQVARQLTQDKKDVVVIENNPEIAKSGSDALLPMITSLIVPPTKYK